MTEEMQSKRRVLLLLFGFALAVVAIACTPGSSSSTAAPTVTATSTPSPTPEPQLTPIAIDRMSRPEAFLAALPEDEVNCLTTEIRRPRVVEILSETGDQITADESRAFSKCVTEGTAQLILVSGLYEAAGGLTGETVACITKRSRLLPTDWMAQQEPTGAVISVILQSLFCLSPDERSRAEDSGSELTFDGLGGIDAMECAFSDVRSTQLDGLILLFESNNINPTLQSLEPLTDILPRLIRCGVIEDEHFADLGMTAKQAGCLIDELGFERIFRLTGSTGNDPEFEEVFELVVPLVKCKIELDGIADGTPFSGDQLACLASRNNRGESRYQLLLDAAELQYQNVSDISTEVLEVFVDCAIDPGVLDDDHQRDTPRGTPLDPDNLPVTSDQLDCLTQEIGRERMAELLAGEAPDLALLAALSSCGIDLDVLISADATSPTASATVTSGTSTAVVPTRDPSSDDALRRAIEAAIGNVALDCVLQRVTENDIAQSLAGSPSPDVIDAAQVCNVDLSDLSMNVEIRSLRSG